MLQKQPFDHLLGKHFFLFDFTDNYKRGDKMRLTTEDKQSASDLRCSPILARYTSITNIIKAKRLVHGSKCTATTKPVVLS